MSGKEDILETKLDILITDFQRFRESQEKINKSQAIHSIEEDKVQAKILTTLYWHTLIGGGIIATLGYHFISKGI